MSIRHATLNQLRIFKALSEHESVVRTAEALHLTPPAVSIQIKQLSEHVGHPLLEQIGKQLHLTAQGRLVALACQDVFDRIESLTQELAALEGLERGSLSVAIITTASYLVPRVLGDFCAEHPGIEVAMHVGNRETILERIERNEDDLYILGQPPDNVRISASPFAPNPLIVVGYPGHHLANRKSITPAELAREPYIVRERGSGTRRAVEDFFAGHDLAPNIRLKLGSNEAIKQSIAGHLGYSVLSESTVRSELASGELIRLNVKGMPLERQWYAAHPKNKILSPAAKAFRTFLESHASIAAR